MDSELFSAIKLLPLLEKKIAGIKEYPLNPDNLVIQQDVYKRLATLDYDILYAQEEAYEVFATLESARKEKDSDLRFALELNAVGALLSIEGIGAMFFEYDEYFDKEEDAAEQLVLALQMLASGQLATLITTRHGRSCASELLAFEKNESIPKVLSTEGNYRRFWKKDDENGYESTVMRNTYIAEQIDIPKEFFLVERDKKGKFEQRGRIFKNGDLSPLTKKAYLRALEQIGNTLTGQKEGEDEFNVLARSWEFWVISAVVAFLIYIASSKGFMPRFFADIPFIIVPIATTLAGFLATLIIIKKNSLREANPNSPIIKAEGNIAAAIGKYAYVGFGSVTSLALLATCFMPIYIPHDTSNAVSYWAIAEDYLPAYIAPALFLAAFYTTFIKNKRGALAYLVSILTGVAWLIFVNFTKTNTDVSTPEPYTTIALSCFLVAPIIAIFMLVARFRNPAKDTMSPFTEIDGEEPVQVSTEELEKGSQKIRKIRFAQIVIGYVASIALALAGYLYRTIPDASLTVNDGRYLMGGLFGVALVLLIGTILFHARLISTGAFSWIGYLLVLALFIGWSQIIREGADEGSDVAWVLMFVSGLSVLAILSVSDYFERMYGNYEEKLEERKDKK